MGISEWPTRSDRTTAGKFAIIYILWSALWVVGSDFVMHRAIHGPDVEWQMESYKGIVYVLISGLILYLAIRERDRKHKAELARNECIVRSLRQSGLVGIYEWRADGRITDANSTLLQSLGYSREELASGKLTREALTPPEYWQADQIADGQISKVGRCALYEKEVVRKDGSRMHLVVGRARLEGSKDVGVGYALDVSQLKEMEAKHALLQQQLWQSEKLNALGQLAGGIAHDFNNLLSIMVGYANLTESKLGSEDSELQENIAQILRAADKSRSLTQKLLAFGRQQVLHPELLNLNEVISELCEMLSGVVDERIRLDLQLGPKLGIIEAERSQVEQVIVNLVINARDAMPNGGTLTIQTFGCLFRDDTQSQLSGEYTSVRVSDTGMGMDEAIQLRIFEPFFTTKRESGGTGLGLATVYGIVKQCRGHITVDSTVGQGSTFTVYFPRMQGPQLVTKNIGQAKPAGAGSETILLVEDMQEIREMMAAMLRSQGYRVLEAGDGYEAVNVATSHAGPIHLVLSDVVMPNLNGPDAVSRIRARRSGMKVIYMTGYSFEAFAKLGKDSIVVEKPIQFNVLLGKIRDLLDQSGPERAEGI